MSTFAPPTPRLTTTTVQRDEDDDRFVESLGVRVSHCDHDGEDRFTFDVENEGISVADFADFLAAGHALLNHVDPSGLNRRRPDDVAFRLAVRDVLADNTLPDIRDGLAHLECCTYDNAFERAVWTEAERRLVDLEECGEPVDASCRCGGQGCGQCGDQYGCVA
jgi:hypothetical protein